MRVIREVVLHHRHTLRQGTATITEKGIDLIFPELIDGHFSLAVTGRFYLPRHFNYKWLMEKGFTQHEDE